MKRKFLGAFLLSVATSVALPAYGSSGAQQGQQGQAEVPNVLIVKVKKDKDGVQQFDGAQVTPVRVTLQRGQNGELDVENMVQQAEQAAQTAQAIDLKSNQFQDAELPDSVRQVFQQADATHQPGQLAWRWYWNNGNWGYFGYGNQPYWGWYNNYYPNYGYHYGGYTYPYSWAYYNSYPGYYYNYYYRW